MSGFTPVLAPEFSRDDIGRYPGAIISRVPIVAGPTVVNTGYARD